MNHNLLRSLPRQVGDLTALAFLTLQDNQLTWLPMSLERLPARTKITLARNALALDLCASDGVAERSRLGELYEATSELAMIRDEALEICIATQDLFLPALVTLEIIDAAFPNAIAMHRKWELVVAVKHWRQRRQQ